jgi:hypothetical protein
MDAGIPQKLFMKEGLTNGKDHKRQLAGKLETGSGMDGSQRGNIRAFPERSSAAELFLSLPVFSVQRAVFPRISDGSRWEYTEGISFPLAWKIPDILKAGRQMLVPWD